MCVCVCECCFERVRACKHPCMRACVQACVPVFTVLLRLYFTPCSKKFLRVFVRQFRFCICN